MTIGRYRLQFNITPDGWLVIPAEAKEVPYEFFYGNKGIIKVFIGDGVEVGERAFANCSQLKEIVFLGKAPVIGHGAFANCEALVRVAIPDGAVVKTAAFTYCIGLEEVVFLGEIPSIGEEAFSACKALTHITIPDGTVIGDGAFSLCSELNKVLFAGRAPVLGEDAFCSCKKLKYMAIPEGTNVAKRALAYCEELKTVVVSLSQDLSGCGLQLGAHIVRRALSFVPRFKLKYWRGIDHSDFKIGKKFMRFLLLILYRKKCAAENALGLPVELDVFIMSFVNTRVLERVECVIPEDEALAAECLSPDRAIAALQSQEWLRDFEQMPQGKGFTFGALKQAKELK